MAEPAANLSNRRRMHNSLERVAVVDNDTRTARSRILRAFDEQAYLAFYPDIAAAVAKGIIGSGLAHFEAFGLNEGRFPCPVPRRQKLLSGVDVAEGQGVEVGALANPVVSKQEGRILYVDFTDTQTLRRNYATNPNVDVGQIVDVDAVWGSHTLQQCLPNGFKADYLIASHVVEHVPDLLGWLNEVSDILAPSGEMRLAVPDRRYTFDILRRETGIGDILDAHLRRSRVPSPQAILEFLMFFRKVDVRQAWLGKTVPEKLEPLYPIGTALEAADRVFRTGAYIDAHCWVFTPLSFAQLLHQAVSLGLLRLECVDFQETTPFEIEFFVGLRVTNDQAQAIESWAAIVERIQHAESLAQQQDVAVARVIESGATPQTHTTRPPEQQSPTQATDTALRDLATVQHELSTASGNLEALRRSHSWRLTRPLRALAQILRRQ